MADNGIKLYSTGSNSHYIEEDKSNRELTREIDRVIDQFITKQAVKGAYIEIPRLTEEERAVLRVGIVAELLREQGTTEEEIENLIEESRQEYINMIEQKKEHEKLSEKFRVINTPKNNSN